MTLTTLLRDARRDCATLTRGQRFDRWLRVWRPAAMALHRKDGPFQGSHLNAWLKIADRLLDACGTEHHSRGNWNATAVRLLVGRRVWLCSEGSTRADALRALVATAKAIQFDRPEEKYLADRLPKNSAGLPILPGDHLLVARTKQEVVVEGIGSDNTILVGGLPGVDDDCWNEEAEDLCPIPEKRDA